MSTPMPSDHIASFPDSLSHIYIGLDVGSTTVKALALNDAGETVFSDYGRHLSQVRPCAARLLGQLKPLCQGRVPHICIAGSGGIDIARELGVPFIQEVLACTEAIASRIPDADVVIELGGEDAKLIYLTGGVEQRMNETCAGGTGAFIDQMAAFIGVDAAGLDRLAQNFHTIYPIASRCGVFAKTDVLPLLNEGCRREDIAASIMQAVVGQTISGLAQGRPIAGKAVFLGGPLHFLPALRQRFQQSLPQVSAAVFPEDGHFFVALGAALHCREASSQSFNICAAQAVLEGAPPDRERKNLPPLFDDESQWRMFRQRHEKAGVESGNLEEAGGPAWLGFDSGSTTLKAVLIDEQGRLIYSWYGSNRGAPLAAAVDIMQDIYRRKPPDLHIRAACATGYGSALLTAALRLDEDEVETVAHFTAARYFDPEVSFILDIGGQDIKCMRTGHGAIERISLNEACSAGCGSFIENFSQSLGISLDEFVHAAISARTPADLGTRCTVFMNSRVKQAQKEGANVGDIAAGLSYSVVRNAIYKVMKIANVSELGGHVVAQGGAFLNDALLRALELELGIDVVRPEISGLMGAFGAALIARKRHPAGAGRLLTAEQLRSFQARNRTFRCKGCANACLLTMTSFADGGKFISGNRCERGAGSSGSDLPNVARDKLDLLFSRPPLPLEKAKRGVIGIPRTLNIYENYPLWHGLLTHLGFRVELSRPSSKELYFSAFDTIPSQTVCYPAKLAHGHVQDLVTRGIRTIFFPCVQREQHDADFRHGTYNCPVVAGYPELLNLNMGVLSREDVVFVHDFLPLDRQLLARRLAKTDFFGNIPLVELEAAVRAGFAAMEDFRAKMREAGEQALAELQERGSLGIVLAGHPYHIDPEVNHGIPELINSCGLGVLTEDSISHLMPDAGHLRVVDQWAYHSRLYRAGAFTAQRDNLAVLQLVSFGCGLDAITADQLEEIVVRQGRLYAQIKIDEGFNLGPPRIRIRSLLAAMRERQGEEGRRGCAARSLRQVEDDGPSFLPEMRHTHTLLVPQMSPMHFQFVPEIFASAGYDAVLLPTVSRRAIELGLRYVNNDACYPAIVVIGQLLEAIRSGRYDDNKIALVISQTGGGCRATNYVAFLRRALVSSGLGHVPIASFSTAVDGPGIRLTFPMLARVIMACHYGDALLRTTHRLRPYESEAGATAELAELWAERARANISSGSLLKFQRNMFALVRDFDRLPLRPEPRRPRIGIVGEILLKYHPDANNHAARVIEEEGGEAAVTDVMDFFLYNTFDHIYNYKYLAGSKKNWILAKAALAWQELTRLSLRVALARSKRFSAPSRLGDLQRRASRLLALGHQSGEGWLLAAEMIRMLEEGVAGILCIQPFGCLPNHIVGKGVIGELKRRYPNAAIMALDYDPGASEVNQINRIKLMMRSGMKTLKQAGISGTD